MSKWVQEVRGGVKLLLWIFIAIKFYESLCHKWKMEKATFF